MEVEVPPQLDIHSISKLFSVEQKPKSVISLKAAEGESVRPILRRDQLARVPLLPDFSLIIGKKFKIFLPASVLLG